MERHFEDKWELTVLYLLLRPSVMAVPAASRRICSAAAILRPVILDGADLAHAAALFNLGLLLDDGQLRPLPRGLHVTDFGQLFSETGLFSHTETHHALHMGPSISDVSISGFFDPLPSFSANSRSLSY